MSAKPKEAKAVDVHVGAQIRTLRIRANMSQEKLAEHCGITFQQIQKYERAGNRVSCSRLAVIADVLGVCVSEFFPASAQPKTSESKAFRAVMQENEKLRALLQSLNQQTRGIRPRNGMEA